MICCTLWQSMHRDASLQAWVSLPLQIKPELADEWDRFSGVVLQEFIYDAWWGRLSPDLRFVAHTRFVFNDAFAALLQRGRALSPHCVLCHILDSVSVRTTIGHLVLSNTIVPIEVAQGDFLRPKHSTLCHQLGICCIALVA